MAAANTRIDNVLSNIDPAALDSLTEVVSAFQSADSSLTDAIAALGTGATSALADEIARATAAEATLTSDLAAEVSRATAAESALDIRVSDIESNYLDKRTGGTINGNVDITGTITASGGLEISASGSSSTSLFVGDGVVGVNTETPTEALEVVGNGKFSGTVEIAAPTASGHASTKGYVDGLFAKQQAFSVNIPVGTEQMSVSFGSAFSSVPVINASLEGEVIYFHVIKNKTVNGFDIIFSDEVQEAGVILNVFASNQ